MAEADLGKQRLPREQDGRYVPELLEGLGDRFGSLVVVLDEMDLLKELKAAYRKERVHFLKLGSKEESARDDDVYDESDDGYYCRLLIGKDNVVVAEHRDSRIDDDDYLVSDKAHRQNAGSDACGYALVVEDVDLRELSARRRRRKVREEHARHVGNERLLIADAVLEVLADDEQYQRIDHVIAEHQPGHYQDEPLV